MASSLPKLKNYSIMLKFTAESFAPLQAIREKAPGARRPPFPYLNLLPNLPLPLLETYKEVLAKIAANKSSFKIKTFAPIKTSGRADHMSKKGFSAAAFELEAGPIESFREEIYAELKGAFAAEKARLEGEYKFVPRSEFDMIVNKDIPNTEADKAIQELAANYKDGAGELVAESILLKEYLHKHQGFGEFLGEYKLQGPK